MSRDKFAKENISFGLHLKAFRLGQKLNLQDFAKTIGISQGYLSEVEHGKKAYGKQLLDSLKRIYGMSLDDVMSVREEKSLDPGNKSVIQSAQKLAEGDFVLIPQMRGDIAAGPGLIPDDSADIRVAFRRDWIQRHGDPSRMSLIRVSGDSMEPTLLSGDLVLVDHNHNYLDPSGGIYAVAVNDHIMVKRVQYFPRQNRVKIISDNATRYEAEEHPADDVNINGKVIWFGRELER